MTKKISVYILTISVLMALFLYGCGSHGGGVIVTPSGDRNITSREGVIDGQGRLSALNFQSGTKIEALEENTLTPGIKVTVTEESLASGSANRGYFSNNTLTYMYRITAFSAGDKTNVTTIEKPFTVTLPILQTSQVFNFIGFKESDSDPWRFFSLSDDSEILANMAGIRLAGATTKEYKLNIFRLGVLFALVSYDYSEKSQLSETIVTGLTASSTSSIAVKNGKYCDDLRVKGVLKGIKIDSLRPTELKARITYRSNQADEALIKVNDANVIQKNKLDKTVPTYTYLHSFDVDSITGYSLNSNSGDFSFTLNLKDVETKSFPKGFLIEFYNKITNDKILPYIYSEFFTLSEKEAVDVVIMPETGSSSSESGFYELNPSFTIDIGKELTDSDKQKVEDAVSVSGVESDKITKTWDGDKLIISFAEELEPGTTYKLKIDDVTDIEGISIKDVEDLSFKTKDSDTPQSAYSITYNLDGGSLAKSNPTNYNSTSDTIKLNNPTREGYTFVGWTGTGITTPDEFVIIEKGSSGDKSFTANWSVNSYKLTLNKGLGIATVTGDGMHQFGEAVTASCTMVDGYDFDFWTGNNGESEFNMPARDVEMQANARLKTFSITCNLNGGNVAAPNQISYNLISDEITLINPTREGYTFDGWSGSNGDLPQIDVTINTGSTGDKIYNANWSVINYNIEYFLGGGTVATENPESYNITSANIALVNPTKGGFRFVGWTGSNGDEPEPSVTIETGSTGNRKYNANFVQATNTINYKLNGGTNHPNNPHGFNTASATFTLYPASKIGYTFIGWTGSNGDVPQMSVTIESGTVGDLNYTANFEEVPYTISYLLNGGTNSALNPTGYAVYTPTFTLGEPTRPDHAFVGWTEGAATFPQMLPEVPRGSTGDKVFTAHWVECETFYLPGGVPLVMHKIPHGTFIMGSPNDELGRAFDGNASKESPQHQVTISKDFYIGKFEVTQAQYEAIMGTNPSSFTEYADSPSRPVENICWNDAKAFCASLTNYIGASIPDGFTSFDLPTEAQWEYACRAGTTTSLNNGTNITVATGVCDNLSVLAWYVSISNNQTHAVGKKAPNAWGLYDMYGNVLEWCLDCYNETYYSTCGDCTDPICSSVSSNRVLRGGSWYSYPYYCRSAYRFGNYLGYGINRYGFRVILAPAP